MREIKFRGWHPEAKDMVYFNLGEDNIVAYSMEESIPYTFNMEDGFPIMQYTGLKDKNGNDMVKPNIYEVKYIEWKGKFQGVNENKYTDAQFFKGMKIIGNIYENPELLEQP